MQITSDTFCKNSYNGISACCLFAHVATCTLRSQTTAHLYHYNYFYGVHPSTLHSVAIICLCVPQSHDFNFCLCNIQGDIY